MVNELDLAKLADVRAWLGFAEAKVEFDGDLQRLITACSTTMQRMIGRTITTTDYRESMDGPGSAFMVLRNTPIQRVASVVVDGRPIEPQYVTFDRTALYLSGGHSFARGRNNVALKYRAGYDDVPFDLAQACIETVGLRWRERDRIGMTSKSLAGETTAFSLADFSPSAKSAMNTYMSVAPV